MTLLGKTLLALPALLLAIGCSQTASDRQELELTEVSVPLSQEEKRRIRASTEVRVDGRTYRIGYRDLVRTNQVLPKLGGAPSETEVFGLLKDRNGHPRQFEDGSPWVCSNGSGPDHTSLIRHGESLFAITQLECAPGGAYITKLEQDDQGTLTALATRSVDFSGVYGTYVNCAGMTTPWGTHLGSEEYEPPMGRFDPTASDRAWFGDPSWHDAHMRAIADYNQLENTAENAAYFGYMYGWTPEIAITSDDGDHRVTKHFAMGRFAHELAYVMPDNRTLYLSDDGTNVGLYMFVADRPKVLSAGRLYAARWAQTSGEGAGEARLEWIDLGHASNDEIRAAIERKTTFADLFDKTAPIDATTGTCPDGFTSTNTYDEGLLCTRLVPGMAKIASRLETRLYAAHLGATTEFRKEEGITFNPDDSVLYVAMSQLTKGMEDGSPWDIGGPNHVRLARANPCGAVYGLSIAGGALDTEGKPIDSRYVASDMRGVVIGSPKDYSGTALSANTCDVDGIANPDNISYLPGYKTLVIGEDTGAHQNDYLWSYGVRDGSLTRIATTPYGAESTSPFWHTNINGYGYLTLVVQHPYGESDVGRATSPEERESRVGYIGPFPALD